MKKTYRNYLFILLLVCFMAGCEKSHFDQKAESATNISIRVDNKKELQVVSKTPADASSDNKKSPRNAVNIKHIVNYALVMSDIKDFAELISQDNLQRRLETLYQEIGSGKHNHVHELLKQYVYQRQWETLPDQEKYDALDALGAACFNAAEFHYASNVYLNMLAVAKQSGNANQAGRAAFQVGNTMRLLNNDKACADFMELAYETYDDDDISRKQNAKSEELLARWRIDSDKYEKVLLNYLRDDVDRSKYLFTSVKNNYLNSFKLKDIKRISGELMKEYGVDEEHRPSSEIAKKIQKKYDVRIKECQEKRENELEKYLNENK